MPAPVAVCAAVPVVVSIRYLQIDRVPAAAWQRLSAFLSPEERGRAERFRPETDRASLIAAHALLRAELGRVAGVDGRNLVFRQDHLAKPRTVAPAAALRFGHSLTHCRGLAACAVAEAAEVGVDAETLPERDIAMTIAEAQFSPVEVRNLRATAPGGQAAAFARLWVLKEAYLKALGRGLAGGLDTVSFLPHSASPATVPDEAGDPSDWHCTVRAPVPGVFVAAAVRADAGRFPKWDWVRADTNRLSAS